MLFTNRHYCRGEAICYPLIYVRGFNGTFFDLNGNAEYVRRTSTLSARLMHRVEKRKKKGMKPVQANKRAKKQKLYSIVFTIASINYQHDPPRLPIWNLPFQLYNLSHRYTLPIPRRTNMEMKGFR